MLFSKLRVFYAQVSRNHTLSKGVCLSELRTDAAFESQCHTTSFFAAEADRKAQFQFSSDFHWCGVYLKIGDMQDGVINSFCTSTSTSTSSRTSERTASPHPSFVSNPVGAGVINQSFIVPNPFMTYSRTWSLDGNQNFT